MKETGVEWIVELKHENYGASINSRFEHKKKDGYTSNRRMEIMGFNSSRFEKRKKDGYTMNSRFAERKSWGFNEK